SARPQSPSVRPLGQWIVPVPVQLLSHPSGALIQRTGDLAVAGPRQPGAFDRPLALEGDTRTFSVDLLRLIMEQDRVSRWVDWVLGKHGRVVLWAAAAAASISRAVHTVPGGNQDPRLRETWDHVVMKPKPLVLSDIRSRAGRFVAEWRDAEGYERG